MQFEAEDAAVFRGVDGPLQIEVHLDESSDHNLWSGLSRNVAEGGIFIATHRPIGLGTVVEVLFRLRDKKELTPVTGVVRWTRSHLEGSDGSAGIGIKFGGLSSEASGALSEFAENVREPIFFDLEEAPMRRSSRPTPPARPTSVALSLG